METLFKRFTIQWDTHHFLSVVCNNHVSISHRFWDIQRRIMLYT